MHFGQKSHLKCRLTVLLGFLYWMQRGKISAAETAGDGVCTVDADGRPAMEIECADRKWSGEEPLCQLITCTPPMTNPKNGNTTCDNRNHFGSVCTFECGSRYELVGSRTTTCEDDDDGDADGVWSNPKPICEASDCEDITIQGATKTCTNGNLIDSICYFQCSDPDFEYIGNPAYTCVKGDPKPDWDKEINGRCQRILCPSYPLSGENPREDVGVITCGPSEKKFGNQWGLNAICNITCNPGYQIKDKIRQAKCISTGTWNVYSICCVECTINVNLDVVVLLDSTESIDGVDILRSKADFLIGFTNYITSFYGFNLNITFVAYGEFVAGTSRIGFMEIDSHKPAGDDLLERLYALSPTTGPSNSGKALQYANEVLLRRWSEFRAPMIFLLTARKPSDLKLAMDVSQQIRDRLIHLRIVPLISEVEAFPGDAFDEFSRMVGEDEDAVVEEYNEEDLFDTASVGMAEATRPLCNEHTQDTQFCLFEDPFFDF